MGELLFPSGAAAQTLPDTGSYQQAPAPVDGTVGTNGNGGDGSPGSPGPLLTVTSPGGPISLYLNSATPVVTIVSNGGRGGDGGESSNAQAPNSSKAGAGGGGGDGGIVSLDVQRAQITADGGTALRLASVGGTGGDGGREIGTYGVGGAGGDGGAGRSVSLKVDGSLIIGKTLAPTIMLTSVGGDGGDASYAEAFSAVTGRNGGNGKSGGDISATIGGEVNSTGTGVLAVSIGGDGGNGGRGGAVGSGNGGRGGAGGAAGKIDLTLNHARVLSVSGSSKPLYVQSITARNLVSASVAEVFAAVQASGGGGIGGDGGDGSGFVAEGGSGGSASADQAINITSNGTEVRTAGYGVLGLLAQSIGGHGGNGAFGGGIFFAEGGRGLPGGDAGAVTIDLRGDGNPDAQVSTSGDYAAAITAQSIGGGGGYGGGASAAGPLLSVALGGNSSTGGVGGAVVVRNGLLGYDSDGRVLYSDGQIVSTKGYKAAGLLIQSVGGGGGAAGDAVAIAPVSLLSVAVGGSAGKGGDAKTVEADNAGLIATDGAIAHGIDAQSIGGGGGSGGAAYSVDAGVQLTVAAAVGGSGGNGGNGGAVQIANDGQISTSGSTSYGVIAQSVGGGGGHGGTSKAVVVQALSNPELPSVSLALSLGGSGGTGGDGGNVRMTNHNAVLTSGAGSIGVFLQSIGGGGGDGGDAASMIVAPKGSTFTVATDVGGDSGNGGNGGSVSLTNDGFIATFGAEAKAVLAQSVGGGGGVGGYGHSDAIFYDSNEKNSLAVTVAVGGKAGIGGIGGNVVVLSEEGGIATNGDDSPAVFAQSVGGGGGIGGGAKAMGSGGAVTFNVGVGGDGGLGGHGGDIIVTNAAAIYTHGGGSNGVFAQSVGGGGGIGGSAASGGVEFAEKRIGDYLARAADLPDGVIDRGNDLFELQHQGKAFWAVPDKLRSFIGKFNEEAPPTPTPDKPSSDEAKVNINVGAAIGGKAGAGGNGGAVNVINFGSIATDSALSNGVFAQSVGGSGGIGGAATGASDEATVRGSLSVGGGGGSAGSGGAVNASTAGNIATSGDVAYGIFAQSVGGGGGGGGATLGKKGALTDYIVNLGGHDAASGDGGSVKVQAVSTISTAGKAAIAIVAQSIGGGGGTATILSSNVNDVGIAASYLDDSTLAGTFTTKLGGAGGATGVGGAVSVSTSAGNITGATITTSGRNAYGILAQSIGGGGGIITAGTPTTSVPNLSSYAGDGGAISVTIPQSKIVTSGDGAAGIVAQSVGARGGIVGGLADIDLHNLQTTKSVPFTGTGQGGNISIVTGSSDASITTTGARAHGIFAQSIGGGGGLFAAANGNGTVYAGEMRNCYSGITCTGTISIENDGNIDVSGAGSYGVFAQSRGSTADAVHIVNGNYIRAHDRAAGAIFIDTDMTGQNTIRNNSVIEGSGGVAAIDGVGATVTNSGLIVGDILASRGGQHTVVNQNAGIIAPARSIQGDVTNRGTLIVSHAQLAGVTIAGNLESSGDIVIDASFDPKGAPVLSVDGSAQLSGRLLIIPRNLSNQPTPVLISSIGKTISTEGLAVSVAAPGTSSYNYTATNQYLFNYKTIVKINILPVLYVQADMNSVSNLAFAPGLNANERSAAGSLEAAFASGDASYHGSTFQALSEQAVDQSSYARILDNLGGQTLSAIAANGPSIGRAFVSSMLSCHALNSADYLNEANCDWARISHSWNNFDGRMGSTSKTTRYQLGFEREFAGGWFAGASASYNRHRVSARGLGDDFRGHGVSAGAFVKRQSKGWLFAASISGGQDNYDGSRAAALAPEFQRSSPKLDNLAAQFLAERQFALKNFYILPRLDVGANYTHLYAINETGKSLPLAVDAATNWALVATPSIEIGSRSRVGNLLLRPFVAAGAVFEHSNDFTINSRFLGDLPSSKPFSITSAVPNVLAKLSGGLEVGGWRGLQFDIRYDAELARSFRSQTIRGRLSWAF